MDQTRVAIAFVSITLAVVSAALFLYFFVASRKKVNLRSLMASQAGSLGAEAMREQRMRLKGDDSGQELERLKAERKALKSKKQAVTLEERFFRAGMFSEEDKKEFARWRLMFPLVLCPAFMFAASSAGADLMIGAGVFGLLGGLQLPFTLVDRRVKRRNEEIMFFLPLVIEQIAIGVSSSLDIGPCLQRVVSMADERDSHNVVTELVRHTQFYVKSGVSLEDALTEVGKLSGHTELKHSFMALSQVAKHGGEISRQLQELADAVASTRETNIEAKIKKLELEATAPVALVFMGFLIILLIGFGLQIKGAF